MKHSLCAGPWPAATHCRPRGARRAVFPTSPAVALLAGLCILSGKSVALAQSAVRDLSAYVGPGETFTVVINLTPGAAVAAALEESPPAGWPIANVSDTGSWDPDTQEIKWGPFFEGSIPLFVTYDVTPPGVPPGEHCFSGLANFGLGDEPIAGDTCVTIVVPAVSMWGMLLAGIAVLTAGTLTIRASRTERELQEPVKSR